MANSQQRDLYQVGRKEAQELIPVIDTKIKDKSKSVLNDTSAADLTDLRDLCQLNLLREKIERTFEQQSGDKG